jgi:hypothetical protein
VIAPVVLIGLAGIAPLVNGNLARWADVEVSGPVRDLVVSLGSAGEARLAGELLPGERQRIAVPLPVRDASAAVAPQIGWNPSAGADPESAGRGSARFLGYREDRASARIEDLPPGLRARTRPPIGPVEPRLRAASLALLPACLVVGLLLRRRSGAALLFAVSGSAAVLFLGWPRGAQPGRKLVVLETDADSGAGLEVTATWERARAPQAELEDCVVESSNDAARVVWTRPLGSAGEWTATAHGSALWLLRAFARGAGGDRALAETWLREDGEWTARGPWRPGQPLPPPVPGPPPPGWLAAGLPQGIPVLVGRAADGSGPGEELWVRETGFRDDRW